ncbi:MAG: 4Fe-4S binding protein [Clostridia bacterium]|nr:4Fe-4S binding protein [Clostridia bacterium]
MSDKINLDEISSIPPEINDTSSGENKKTEKKPNRFISWLKKIKPSKRKIIQLYSALLFNANLKGFKTGVIYQGNTKNLCCPGINCYSCPGANTACPLGSLQNAMTSADKSTIFYILGILVLYGLLAGRWICGWLCPFGLIQELFYKIKTPKLKKSKFTRALTYLKYVILVFFVFVIPILYSLRNTPVPAFCKYICPAGTLEGAMGLLSNKVNESSLRMLGPIFTWKFLLMVSIIVASIFIFRFFCRFFCPLGLLYGFFNKISIFGIKLDKPKCIDCGKCISKCKMDIKHVGDVECISCGECIDVCPTKAISFKGSKILLLDNEISGQPSVVSGQQDSEISDTVSPKKQKMTIEKKRKIFKTVLYSLMAILLIGSLVYYNFIHKNPDNSGKDDSIVIPSGEGYNVGDKCFGMDIPLYDENGLTENTFNISNSESKVSILFIWNDTDTDYLTYFNDMIAQYGNKLTVFAIASSDVTINVPELMSQSYKNSSIIFGSDTKTEQTNSVYRTMLEGKENAPLILVLNKNKAIISRYTESVKLDTLTNDIDTLMTGNEVGDKCYGMDIPLYDENGLTENTFNVADNKGKITIINFWGTWCGPCVAELPHFNAIAEEYKDSVTVLAIHSNRLNSTATKFINETYPNSNIVFGKDFPNESGKIVDPEVYYTLLGGANNSYPMTVIVDQNGIIAAHYIGSITHEELVADIEKLLK